MKISVIIPTINESAYITATLDSVVAQCGPVEVIVVDGHSTDDTCEKAARYARVQQAPRGRAAQLNAGWKAATGDAFLFVHADTVLPAGALSHVRRALASPTVEAGAFSLRFDASHWLLQLFAWCSSLNLPSLCFGDRTLFVRRSTMEEVGGFASIPIFEDLQLVRVLYRRGGFRFLKPAVTTASRRFSEHGVLRQQVRNAFLWLSYQFGTPPSRLAHRFTYDR